MRLLFGCVIALAVLLAWPALYWVLYICAWPASLCCWLWTQGNPDAARRLYDRLGL